MAYKSVFETKPKAENMSDFCSRIVKFLNDIKIYDGIAYTGLNLLNEVFRRTKMNTGFSSIDDLIKEYNPDFANIFNLARLSDENISVEEILVNIDIIVNSFNSFERTQRFNFSNDSIPSIRLLYDAIEHYLLSLGYKMLTKDDQIFIVENNIAIDLDEIKDKDLKEDVISFYDYKNEMNVNEKKKIMFALAVKLETKKPKIEKILGSGIKKTLFSYLNNINMRHDNSDPNDSKYYNPKVEKLTNEELIEWYNYTFAFAMNVYLSYDKLKDINVDGGYK